jgi:hypothetical protein
VALFSGFTVPIRRFLPFFIGPKFYHPIVFFPKLKLLLGTRRILVHFYGYFFKKSLLVKKQKNVDVKKTQNAVSGLFCGIGYRYVLKLREVSLRSVFRVFFG